MNMNIMLWTEPQPQAICK